MPTYSYECTECSNRFDVVQSFTDDSLTTCEECFGRLRKLFHAVGVVFKGSGFYRTDSREATKKSKSSSGGSSSSESSSSSGSSDAKTSSTSSSSREKSTSSAAPAAASTSS
ncbi:FmdB family zinc ribbon protein [Mycobacterium ulcerans]|uniref:Conserved hypothetical serine rich protein n=1 Tax=Mycobacterium ulcerans subsp. shinshuense TaxID=1124626 RepID=A0A1B4XZI4_MYCUL|nr:FmdB family zinc ribbon protein [Mycobacterium ulcerans]BAV40218.1 conserved hypothetical serine rich protein [Mycobacterium ulcerans subsp. shinshuense]